MEEQKTNYISIWQDMPGMNNIFNELSGDLGDLDFSSNGLEVSPQDRQRNWLIIAYQVSGYVFAFVVCIGMILSADLFIRTQSDNSLVSGFPICSYLSWGVENYSNDACKTSAMIYADATAAEKQIENALVSNLIILVPRKLQSIDILSSPKVRFIQEHTGDTRVSIVEAMDRFTEIKNRTPYAGQDIECQSMTTNENGEISLTCNVLGGSLLSLNHTATRTSREAALDFISRLSDQQSNFQIIGAPKSLSIGTYTSTDGGIKSVFSTVTSLELKLRYLSPNKM